MRWQRLSEVDRFWSCVQKSDGCWLWLAHVNDFGYGSMSVARGSGRRSIRAHRLSWEYAHGAPPPDDLCVLHKCDVPSCVRPDHLMLGTRADNTRDMMVKRRHRLRILKGEAHGCHKLTTSEVMQVVTLHRQGHTGRDIAKRFAVSTTTVHGICRGRIWRHVTGIEWVRRRSVTDDDRTGMRRLRGLGHSYEAIGAAYGVSMQCAWRVLRVTASRGAGT